MSNYFLPTLASLETHRRGFWLTLALQAYRQQHGQLPDRLDELVGPYLDRLPCDPVSGLAFEYRPLGFPFGVASDSRVLAPNTPFVSVPGSQAARREPVTEDYARRNGILSNETSSVNGVNWVSVLANPRLHSPVISEWPQHFSETFSLTPSF